MDRKDKPMKVVHVNHPTLGNICVMEQDIDKFGVQLQVTAPTDIVVEGKLCRFYGKGSQIPVEPDDETRLVLFDGKEKVFSVR